jgi:hypothetical protein
MDFVVLADSDFYANPVVTGVALAATLAAAVILVRTYRTIAGTTLIMPWTWSLLTFACIAATNLYATFVLNDRLDNPYGTFSSTHFLAACGTLCPLVALIGAKRPQHTAWNFVVVSLWGMLALPAAEVVFLQPGQILEINSFRSWFLLALIAVELLNFMATRYAISCALLVVAQLIWLGPWLPFELWFPAGRFDWELLGLLCASSATITAWAVALRPTRADNAYDKLWFDFRDSFGLFWSLRLIERVNDTAKQANWSFDLGWGGFRTKAEFKPLGKLPPEVDAALRNCLQGLLRRFVSREWIAQRLGGEVELPPTESAT